MRTWKALQRFFPLVMMKSLECHCNSTETKAHADQVRSKMMQGETCGAIGKEFDGLVSKGKSMITDGFSPLRG
jgi:hypothetical protein